MRRRILRNMLVQLGCTALVFTLVAAMVMLSIFSSQVNRDLERALTLVGTGIEHNADPVGYLRGLKAAGISERLTLITADGTVIYDSEGDPAQMDNHLLREEIQEASEHAVGKSQRFSPTLRTQTHYYALKLSDGRFLRLSDTRSGALDMVLDLSGLFLLVLAVIGISSAALSLHMTRRIVQPINALNPDAPDEDSVYPEIQPLVQRMTQQNLRIQEYIRTLKARKLEFETVTAQMEEGLLLLNPKGEVIFINRCAASLLKTETAEGHSILSLSRDRVFKEAFQTALGGRRIDAMLTLDGRYHRLHINPVSDSGHVTGFMALITDITEQILSEQKRREFTANVSHELKTPLTSIVGYAEIMRSGIADEKDWKALVGHIYDEGSRMMRLVEDILHLSRLDSGEVHSHVETLDLMEMCRTITQRFQVAADRLHVNLALGGSSVRIIADRHTADEIIANLIDNAIKYNHEGGSVLIHVSEQSGKAVLRVRDTGIGIPREYQDRVFERFFRVDKSRSKATGGTGLGLSIVKHAVTLLGGSIELRSVPGEGTDITVHFPAAPK